VIEKPRHIKLATKHKIERRATKLNMGKFGTKVVQFFFGRLKSHN